MVFVFWFTRAYYHQSALEFMLLPVLISQNLTRVETIIFLGADWIFSFIRQSLSDIFFLRFSPQFIWIQSVNVVLKLLFVSVVIKHNYSLINWSFEGTSRKIQGRRQMVKILTN